MKKQAVQISLHNDSTKYSFEFICEFHESLLCLNLTLFHLLQWLKTIKIYFIKIEILCNTLVHCTVRFSHNIFSFYFFEKNSFKGLDSK